VEIAVFDAMGRRIRTVQTGKFESGNFYHTEWDGKDSNGEPARAGVYLIGIDCGGRKRAQKIIMIP
jgi:flagellar hook assembly protein FlgD